ncbi:hypothetical protein BKA62DRAFT_765626 [Auriculariales sp. MPI-PUGE-AT-0066]|nr:hypothetical protein BKA62DRAFT_765626 [Auriculariales sp. MPI-PUGE-AT-0066]
MHQRLPLEYKCVATVPLDKLGYKLTPSDELEPLTIVRHRVSGCLFLFGTRHRDTGHWFPPIPLVPESKYRQSRHTSCYVVAQVVVHRRAVCASAPAHSLIRSHNHGSVEPPVYAAISDTQLPRYHELTSLVFSPAPPEVVVQGTRVPGFVLVLDIAKSDDKMNLSIVANTASGKAKSMRIDIRSRILRRVPRWYRYLLSGNRDRERWKQLGSSNEIAKPPAYQP